MCHVTGSDERAGKVLVDQFQDDLLLHGAMQWPQKSQGG